MRDNSNVEANTYNTYRSISEFKYENDSEVIRILVFLNLSYTTKWKACSGSERVKYDRIYLVVINIGVN